LTALENAARDGLEYKRDTVVMPVKCTGLVKVSYLLKLFAKGMAGVLVLGCREDDCRYYNGSARCAEIVDETREILDLAGVDKNRLQLHLIGESGGGEVKRVLKGFMKQMGKAAAGAAKGNGGGKRSAAKKGKGAKAAKARGPEKKESAGKAKRKAGRKPGASKKRSKQATRARKSSQTAGTRKGKKSPGSRKTSRGTRTVKHRKGK